MSLRDQLRALAAASQARIGPHLQARIDRMIAELAERGVAASALSAGEMAPDFTLPEAGGRPIALSSLLRDGPLLLIFFRGSWCPYCDLQLRAIGRMLPDLADAGARAVAVSPAPPDPGAADSLGFPLLTDYGNRVARLFGLVWEMPEDVAAYYRARGMDLPTLNGTGAWELPMPASYVIRSDGIVHFAQVDSDYRRRPEPATLLIAARQLRSGA